ncbi:MAG: T9SS type A sorting domain-containing protein [candidate division Zixibacteria bacterium]|nr:T9SS type A sorting domain-containing protein [candidate division Zixibacteria bacterium]
MNRIAGKVLIGTLLVAMMFVVLAASAEAQNFRKRPYSIYENDNTSMKIMWQLNSTMSCTIEWGTDTGYGMGNEVTAEYGSDHQHTYTINNLSPGTRYLYRVTAGGDVKTGSFRSAAHENELNLKFIAYGDSRTFPGTHDEVCQRVMTTVNSDPDFQTFIISVGDLVNDGDSESEWDDHLLGTGYQSINEMLSTLPFQSTYGNHDTPGNCFDKYLPYPHESGGRYWSFDYGPAHFTVIDEYTDYSPGSAQHQWIIDDLSSTDKLWKFATFHEPGWSAGGHDNNEDIQNYIQPLLEQYDVCMIFAGHCHFYARAVVNGIQHITTAGGGGPLYPPWPWYPNVVKTSMSHHISKISIEGNNLYFESVKKGGDIIESFTINRYPSNPVTVNMVPDYPPVTVNPGGSFTFTGTLINNTGNQTTGGVWTMVKAPWGTYYGPTLQIGGVPLAPFQSLSVPNVVQTIPAGAPSGVYEYISYAGIYPSVKLDSSSFEFTIVPPIAGDGDSWQAYGWGTVEKQDYEMVPTEYSLGTNYPNPFNSSTVIEFDAPRDGFVTLKIYNLAGQLVETLVEGNINAGQHFVDWDGTKHASGIYFYTLNAEGKVFTKRMTMVK